MSSECIRLIILPEEMRNSVFALRQFLVPITPRTHTHTHQSHCSAEKHWHTAQTGLYFPYLQTHSFPNIFFFSPQWNTCCSPILLSVLYNARQRKGIVPAEAGAKGARVLKTASSFFLYRQTRRPYNCPRHWAKVMTGVHLLTSVSGTGGFSAWLQLSPLFVYGLAGSYTVHCFLLGGSWEFAYRGELLACRKESYSALQFFIVNLFSPLSNGSRQVVLNSLNSDVVHMLLTFFIPSRSSPALFLSQSSHCLSSLLPSWHLSRILAFLRSSSSLICNVTLELCDTDLLF